MGEPISVYFTSVGGAEFRFSDRPGVARRVTETPDLIPELKKLGARTTSPPSGEWLPGTLGMEVSAEKAEMVHMLLDTIDGGNPCWW
jgi:hypothetical protein